MTDDARVSAVLRDEIRRLADVRWRELRAEEAELEQHYANLRHRLEAHESTRHGAFDEVTTQLAVNTALQENLRMELYAALDQLEAEEGQQPDLAWIRDTIPPPDEGGSMGEPI